VPATTFRDLVVWRKSHEFVLQVYLETRGFPADERFGLTRQLRRSAVSIPANIAEGFVKRGTADKLRYLNIAQGSLEESRYYLILAAELSFADTAKLQLKIEDWSRLLEAYSLAIRTSVHARIPAPRS